MSLSKDSILAAADAGEPQKVPVPEWGGDVHVRVMSGTERDAWEAESYQINGQDVELNRANTRARLLVRCLCDETGKRLFADSDAAALGNKSGHVLDRLFAVAQRVNRLTRKDLEELTKNSSAGPAGDSTSV